MLFGNNYNTEKNTRNTSHITASDNILCVMIDNKVVTMQMDIYVNVDLIIFECLRK